MKLEKFKFNKEPERLETEEDTESVEEQDIDFGVLDKDKIQENKQKLRDLVRLHIAGKIMRKRDNGEVAN